MVQEAKSLVKNLVMQRCVEGFNSGVKGLNNTDATRFHGTECKVLEERGEGFSAYVLTS
jgi:hypothetical protein